jgi:hypothetical protein
MAESGGGEETADKQSAGKHSHEHGLFGNRRRAISQAAVSDAPCSRKHQLHGGCDTQTSRSFCKTRSQKHIVQKNWQKYTVLILLGAKLLRAFHFGITAARAA